MFSNLPDRTRNLISLAFVLVFTTMIIFFISLLLQQNPRVTSRNLFFEVESSGGFANITLQAGSVAIKTSTTVTTPWRRTINVKSGEEVYLTAGNPTQSGKIRCRISYNGQPWKDESIEAPKDGVACAGIVP
jgi:hypothetical protein